MGTRGKRQGPDARQKPNVIRAFPGELEPDARELYDFACRGSEPTTAGIADLRSAMQDQAFRARFYSSAHEGFRKAQSRALQELRADPEPSFAKETVVRKTMDAIAWQMLGAQLYAARRFYRGHKPPKLATSNAESLVAAADHFRANSPGSFALISDLTTFIQVGDLLVFTPEKGVTIAEVKEGDANHQVLKFAQFFASTQCAKAVSYFRDEHGEGKYNQLGRVLRQQARMQHVTQVLNTDSGVDPDTDEQIVVGRDPIETSFWDTHLAFALDDSKRSGWSIEHIEQCLYLGVYRGDMRLASKAIFSAWVEHTCSAKVFSVVNLIDCMLNPLALPIYLRRIPRESMFDILFGRAIVWLAIDADAFAKLASYQGLPLRWSTKREAGELRKRKGGEPWLLENRMLVIDRPGSLSAVSMGLLLRIYFHAVVPSSAVEYLREVERVERTT